MRTKGGLPSREMSHVSVRSKDSSETWFRTPTDETPAIVLPDILPRPGGPNIMELRNVTHLEDFILELLDNDMFITIMVS